ncbi:hypothetical protein, partial [Massilia oculi]|uniref:hypothetical protein n=1 Tax=Massilia oculi TaxID=945844 RepID=UPI001AAE552C
TGNGYAAFCFLGFFVVIASVMEQSSQDYFMTPFHTENLTGSQPLVPSPSPPGININEDISADTVLIVRRVRPENAPAVAALVKNPFRDWQHCTDNMV